jgi:hypothetical protein
VSVDTSAHGMGGGRPQRTELGSGQAASAHIDVHQDVKIVLISFFLT